LRRFELAIDQIGVRADPPRRLRLTAVLARDLAISPDNRRIAVGYGIRASHSGSNAEAHYAVYSLEDGAVVARFRGGV
jgi:hypothetical protein